VTRDEAEAIPAAHGLTDRRVVSIDIDVHRTRFTLASVDPLSDRPYARRRNGEVEVATYWVDVPHQGP
jgi:hypothetical protein